LTLELSPEAKQTICKFVDEVDKKIDELGFKINTKRRKEILSNMEIFFKLHAVKCARKKGANIVDVADVRNALKKGHPNKSY
jgi:hypothetical protein